MCLKQNNSFRVKIKNVMSEEKETLPYGSAKVCKFLFETFDGDLFAAELAVKNLVKLHQLTVHLSHLLHSNFR